MTDDLEFQIKGINIDVTNKKISFATKDGNLIFDCEIGEEGFSKEGEGVEGDKKTPLGNFKVGYIRKPKEGEESVFTVTGERKNLGPALILFDCKYGGKFRGIGIHGSENNTLTPTEGCIRMRNPDLSILKDKIELGIPVTIQTQ